MRKLLIRVTVTAVLAAAVIAQPSLALATAVAGLTCNFNGDSRSDLAVGAPGESVGSLDSAGSVNILYGAGSGITATGNTLINQATPGVVGIAEVGDSFGSAVACGDFNNDNFGDLAVGVPHESVEVSSTNDVYDAGAVNIFYGSASGLTTTGNQIFTQSSAGMPETAERTDEFGGAVATGDFNNDGNDDLAIGSAFENVEGKNQAGNVIVLYGARTGLSTSGSQNWHQATPGVEGELESGDVFGTALASGDFNGDGRADLAVGAPGEEITDDEASGTVNVLYGSAAGLSATNDQIWDQSTAGIPGNWELNDLFGQSLAAGDFNGDNRDDLAVGVPGENDGETRDAGAVNVIYGSANGLRVLGAQIFTRATLLLGGLASTGDQFGTALAAGDFNGNGRDDLAIGAPGIIANGNVAAGRVTIVYGSLLGLSFLNSQRLSQGVGGVEGLSEPGDYLGYALAAGDFNGDGRKDLAAGAPGEADGAETSAGAVSVFYGAALQLSTSNDQIWNQNTAGIEGVATRFDRFGGPAMSVGEYRMGYPTGTRVHVTSDAIRHNPLWRIDMSGIDAGPDYNIAAARDGVIKYIVDENFEPTDNNNYVWIEHEDGEWTKYTHFKTNSVKVLGHQVGDFVTAGTVLGLEGDVGRANGQHLHFEVAVPYNLANPITSTGFIAGINRIPVICGIPGNALFRGVDYTVTACLTPGR